MIAGSALLRLTKYLVLLLSSGPTCVLAEAAHSLLWVAGIDGNQILGSALQPLLTGNAVANGVARWSGQMPGWIYTDLFRTYVTAGGSGATLPLALYLSRSKSTRLRRLGRASLPPGLVNLNAGLIFGAPIIFNPLLALPFLTTTVLNAAVAYLAHVVGWVTPAYIYLPRTIPSPLYALISTGYDIRAVALSVVTWLVIPGIIWLPFFRVWERRVLTAETIQDQPETKGA
jgi:PTS system cellobiose-specific IIC component